MSESRTKANHVGAPAIFILELECQHICDAFDSYGCFLVGSATERADWRDIDLRLIMKDEDFAALFPNGVGGPAFWEHDPRWLLMTSAISEYLSKRTGLPIDFQFQAQTHANKQHKGPRHAIGMRIAAQ